MNLTPPGESEFCKEFSGLMKTFMQKLKEQQLGLMCYELKVANLEGIVEIGTD